MRSSSNSSQYLVPARRKFGGTPGVPMVLNQSPRLDSTFSDELAARLCREYTQEAVDSLVEHMRDRSNPTASLIATNAILDRAYGKPKDVKMLSEKGDDAPKYRVKIEFVDVVENRRTSTPEHDENAQ